MFNNVNRKLIIYYMPTFRAKLEVKEARVKSGFHERLGAKNHWNFRFIIIHALIIPGYK